MAEMGVAACMDLSDGLASDLPKLCEASGVGVEIESASIPCDTAAAGQIGWDAERLAIEGGEDYELLFTTPPEKTEAIINAFNEKGLAEVTRIGTVLEGESITVVFSDGRTEALAGGWQHFPKGES